MQSTDNLKKAVRLGSLSIAKVMRALLDGPCSVTELEEISGLSNHTLHDYMRALRKEHAAHICGWEEDATGRESIRIFKLGAGKDVPRRKKSKAQIARECRQRKKDAQLTNWLSPINKKKAPPKASIKKSKGRPPRPDHSHVDGLI